MGLRLITFVTNQPSRNYQSSLAHKIKPKIGYGLIICCIQDLHKKKIRNKTQRNLLASLSDSSRVRTSPSLTGPLTFLMMKRFWSSMNLTLTWVTCPLDPVRPITFTTIACLIWESILHEQPQISFKKLQNMIKR